MKREQLKKLGLEDAKIDEIMKLHGDSVEKQKQSITALTTERDSYKTQLSETQTELKKFQEMDVEAIKKAAKDWEDKYKADTEKLKNDMSQQAYGHQAEKYLSQYQFSSDLAKNAAKSEFMKQEFKLDGEKFLGADDWIKKLQEDQPSAFKAAEEKPNQPTWGTPPQNNEPPKGDNGFMDSMHFMGVRPESKKE